MRIKPLMVVAVVAAACIERAQQTAQPRRQEVDRSAANAFVVPSIPMGVRPLGAKFGSAGDQIELAGVAFDQPEAKPGSTVRVIFFFRVLNDVDDNWEVFVHIEDGRGGRVNGDHWPTGYGAAAARYPTNAWRRGEIVRDEWAFAVPTFPEGPPCQSASECTSGTNCLPGAGGQKVCRVDHLELWTGLYHGDDRLPLLNGSQVRNDGQNRVMAAALGLRD
jgi:hypothetical protein